jgi:hypothetical protein
MSNFNTTTAESFPIVNNTVIDPDRLVFFVCLLSGFIMLIVNILS